MKTFAELFGDGNSLGIDTSKLGCVMLKTDSPIGKDNWWRDQQQYMIPQKHPIDYHVTLRYGFIPQFVNTDNVKAVLDTCKIPSWIWLSGYKTEAFPTKPGEVAVVVKTIRADLFAIYQQLSVLPNIATYPEYNPHITVGYFTEEWYKENKEELDKHVVMHQLSTGNVTFSGLK